ncbi:hypothetical protein Ccrd_009840 [Cynara cardunculus var. scolymus]|uniref:AP2/ERF domain-containing protein n=1 Tax=Cynara cardunculus var. scolymus TaxID=59895 RepID=A0A103YMI9_CYNCS|nr:hypothetical protein Ccrd_009840 [Cynara cardunculus var. scolymus]
MTKLLKQRLKIDEGTKMNTNSVVVTKAKRTRKTVPRDSPPRRSSIYRGIDGRVDMKLIYGIKTVGTSAYDEEDAAAHAYDLAALKYWGPDTILNFPLMTYHKELKQMEEKAADFLVEFRNIEELQAYDMAAIEYRGLNAVTNFDLSRYIKWLRPDNNNTVEVPPNPNINIIDASVTPSANDDIGLNFLHNQPPQPVVEMVSPTVTATMPYPSRSTTATSALGLLLQSSKFKEMMEMTTAAEYTSTPSNSTIVPPCNKFPEEIQVHFESQDFAGYNGGDDFIFGDLNFMHNMLHSDFDK